MAIKITKPSLKTFINNLKGAGKLGEKALKAPAKAATKIKQTLARRRMQASLRRQGITAKGKDVQTNAGEDFKSIPPIPIPGGGEAGNPLHPHANPLPRKKSRNSRLRSQIRMN